MKMKIKLYGEEIKVKNGRLFDPETGDELDRDYYDMNDIWKAIGLKLHNYYADQHDPVYAVGSSLFAGKKIQQPELYSMACQNLPKKLAKKFWNALPPETRAASLAQFWKDDIIRLGYKAILPEIKELAKLESATVTTYSKLINDSKVKTWSCVLVLHGVIIHSYHYHYDGNKTSKPTNLNLLVGETFIKDSYWRRLWETFL